MIERVQLLPRYRDKNPSSITGKLRSALMRLMEQHRRDGAIPTSMRFLFYELVAQGVIKKDEPHARQKISAALTALREAGHVDWEEIVDETRAVSDFTGSANVAENLLQYLNSARIDPWNGNVPTIITESRSLAGVLRSMCRDYRIRITSTNGQCAGFLHTKLVKLLEQGGRIGYLGDFDLSGGHIEDNTRKVLEELVGDLDWERLALTEKQVQRYNLTAIIKSDKRFQRQRFQRVLTQGPPLKPGEHEAVETEALSQKLIVDIVRKWLDKLLPEPLARFQVREQRERARLRRLIKD